MLNIFVHIYFYLQKRIWLFATILLLLFGAILFQLLNIDLEENIQAIIPHDKTIDQLSMVLNNSKFSDQIIVTFSLKDSLKGNPDELKHAASKFVRSIQLDSTLIKKIRFKTDDLNFKEIYAFFYTNLPFYLSENDYCEIKQKISSKEIENQIKKNYKSLISPAGIATKQFILKDPLSLTPLALKKLQSLQLDANFTIHNSCIYSKDKQHLMLFIEPHFKAGNTQKNRPLINHIKQIKSQVGAAFKNVNISYYGGTAVAVANAERIKSDIIYTVSIAIVFILLLFLLFFKRIKVLLLFFFPVLLGAGIGIALLTLVFGQISAISLSIGAILVGISIDYSLHAFTHFRSNGSVSRTLKDISSPILISSITTGSAFLCLMVLKSEALSQLGFFGAISVFAAALSVLLFLPQFLASKDLKKVKQRRNTTLLDQLAAYPIHRKKWAVVLVVLLSLGFAFTFQKIRFNSQIESLNYLTPELAKAEKQLESISSVTNSTVFLIATGDSYQEALQKMESEKHILQQALDSNWVVAVSAGMEMILTHDEQLEKIQRWNSFWQDANRERVLKELKETGKKFSFNPKAFNQFEKLISDTLEPVGFSDFDFVREHFLGNYFIENNGLYSVIAILNVEKKSKESLYELFNTKSALVVFSKQNFSNQFLKLIKDQFDKLVWITILVVFIILLIAYGRIELALVTFIPILLSWLWILGLIGLFGIELNVFNIIISTFIFGLGVDYCIFITRGLINNYKYGNHPITPYKLSVLLSFITTVVGVGVLIFAQHPALKSIALVSMLGISSVVVNAYIILPLLFSLLVHEKGKTRQEPVTLLNGIASLVVLIVFLSSTLGLILLTLFLQIFTVFSKSKVKYFFSSILCLMSRIFVYVFSFYVKKKTIGKEKLDFSKPVVLASNHQSHFDLVLLLQLYPKIIVITNNWVWHSKLYGLIVRFADYYPVYKGLTHDFERIRKKVKEGYSVLIFPEGTRTTDGKIKRFHQGVFKVADELNLDIQPILIHGAFQAMSRNEMFLRARSITIRFYDRFKVKPIDLSKNETYRQQTKEFTQFARNEFNQLREKHETPAFFKNQTINQYVFKSPVLEWYVKIKLKLEKNYQLFNELIPRKCSIIDLGCGYGYMAYMLRQLSENRKITGYDYDHDKIAIAKHIARNDKNLNFYFKDISKEDIGKADVVIVSDVLHYLPQQLQFEVLRKCMKAIGQTGMILIRDADASLQKRTKRTKLTELFSTRLLNFNKTEYELTFISGNLIRKFAENNQLTYTHIDKANRTSNVTYILKPNDNWGVKKQ